MGKPEDSIDPYDIQGQFEDTWNKFRSATQFWILGNAYDTILDYLDIYLSKKNPKIAPSYAKEGLFKAWTGIGEAWYDDDGWWIVAALKAFSLSEGFGWSKDDRQLFLNFALEKWERFNRYAPYVGRLCVVDRQFEAFVPGGVWNSGWTTGKTYEIDQRGVVCVEGGAPAPRPIPTFWKDSFVNPASGALGGMQNSVTNLLYLIAASRLARLRPVPEDGRQKLVYQAQHEADLYCARSEFGFIDTWFGDPDTPLLNSANARDGSVHPQLGAIIRERVGSYWASMDEQGRLVPGQPVKKTTVKGYKPDMSWMGDQGLLLGALDEYTRMPGNEGWPQDHCTLLIMQIIDGLTSALKDVPQDKPNPIDCSYFSDGDGRFLNWRGSGAPGDLPKAYCTGLGAFLRHLTAACRNPTIRDHCERAGLLTYVSSMVRDLNKKDTRYDKQFQTGGDGPYFTDADTVLVRSVNTLALSLAAYSHNPTEFDRYAAAKGSSGNGSS